MIFTSNAWIQMGHKIIWITTTWNLILLPYYKVEYTSLANTIKPQLAHERCKLNDDLEIAVPELVYKFYNIPLIIFILIKFAEWVL